MKLGRYVFERSGAARSWRRVPLAGKVGAYLDAWITTSADLGKFATTVEVADAFERHERTIWYWRAAIHEVFPGEEMERLVVYAAERLRYGQDPLDVEIDESELAA